MARAASVAGKPSEATLLAALASGSARFILLYGPEETTADEIARRLGNSLGADSERIDLDSARLVDDAGLLAGEAAALSLFGARRWLRLRFRKEEGLDAVAALLASDSAEAPVIATAGNLSAASKLRKLATSHPAARAMGCYSPKPEDAARLLAEEARALGLRLDSRLAHAIAEATGYDRAIGRSEVAKLALYCDAGPDRPVTASADDVAALIARADEEDIGAIVAHTLGGAPARLAAALAVARTLAVSEVSIVKAVQRRATQLAAMAAKIADGQSADALVNTVFWKDKPAIRRELGLWSPVRLARLIARLLDTEQAIMANGRELGAVILEEELLTIARLNAGRR